MTKKINEEGQAYIDSKCCVVCKHCFYSGLPGAVACEYKGFTDHFDTCDKWELSEEFFDEDN